MFAKNSKLSLSSTASEILQKVNTAIEGKTKIEDDDEILELTEMVSHKEKNEASKDFIVKQDDKVEDNIINKTDKEIVSNPADKKTKATKKASSQANQGKKMSKKLVSSNTAETTAALFSKLKESAKTKKESNSLKFDSGLTVEELIAELIKPHLSNWLDDNLPSIVKDTVEKEVKKLLPTDD